MSPTASGARRRPERIGGILGHSAILERLEHGEVFHPGTWVEESIRAAGYDLRIADDFLIVSTRVGQAPLIYGLGVVRRDIITLRPGQVAHFSTAEKVCMPWDLAGQLNIKSSWPRRGLLILGGGQVDPGFGLGAEEERLHFLVMNIGEEEVPLRPGAEKLATLQLLSVQGDVPEGVRNKHVRGMQDVKERLFDADPARPAGVDLALGWLREVERIEHAFGVLQKDSQDVDRRVKDVQSQAQYIITFGIVVLALTFLGVVLSTLLQVAGADGVVARLSHLTAAAGGQLGLLALALTGIAATVGLLGLLYGATKLAARAASAWRRRSRRPPTLGVAEENSNL